MCIYMHVYKYIYIHICIYAHTYIHKGIMMLATLFKPPPIIIETLNWCRCVRLFHNMFARR